MSDHNEKHAARRRTLAYLSAAGLGALTAGLPTLAAAQSKVLRIGYQKYGTLVILKGRGTLEKRFASEGIEIKWTEFTAGPALLEGLNVGSIDFGVAGEAPPIFAQAAGADLVYVGNEPPSPTSEAIIVPKNSTIKTVAELKGKKVALNRGSNVHYLWVKALERAGLEYKDVQTLFLAPADARAAFERGSLDAWVIWDPFLAAAEKQIGARVLEDGTGLVANHQFFLASRSYAEKNPRLLAILLEELDKIDQWGARNLKEVATILAEQTGLDYPTVELAAKRYSYGVKPVSPQVIAEQQKIADVFADLKLIPKKINVRDAVLATKP
ncbi:sulfonate ABC transporter substrate-binding protein [Oxalicibacterium faecigallinarum]|uniref:Putative aliphatic sulfonates-binding protein n=1 Tax=Oxalicibacterium faecigallinarum TaxID=573741 RepID=A0A8J3AZM1_9BURK|nr:sulfonate ABC transporter substrate-binding protein [Oxalicibacterium faecigallinarum]GGI20706.1 sulfonate ABC transporter substrate-binding protein [Oxalicibacterium faecigallinarum]